ncbi:hypothetical protein [Methanosarcina mazei]|uniref:Uncharacterized protein n=1 Tax=Methanosarcina mazei TaxID=2209 RepID=A0A4P8QV93_METMZ|nr:hypothetical protein [Methanosarcina mazei]QCR14816.1 hypothetical protein DKM28_00990 [Methanosarcina mazei]
MEYNIEELRDFIKQINEKFDKLVEITDNNIEKIDDYDIRYYLLSAIDTIDDNATFVEDEKGGWSDYDFLIEKYNEIQKNFEKGKRDVGH